MLLLVGCQPGEARQDACVTTENLEPRAVDFILDGDTLQLKSGQRVRLIGLNTPEIGRKGAADEPLAREAKAALQQFLGDQVWLQWGDAEVDRYGRRLAWAFRSQQGGSAAAELLSRGLGWQVVVPPDIDHLACLTAAEDVARAAGLGVWQQSDYRPKAAAELRQRDTGFRRIHGQVSKVAESRNAFWIDLDDRVALKLRKSDLQHFNGLQPQALMGKSIAVRGWLSWRGASRRQFAPMSMDLRHPAMLESDL